MDLDPIKIILDSIRSIAEGFFASLPQFVIAAFVLLLTPFIGKFVRSIIRRIMKRTKVRPALITLATNLVGIATWIVGVAIAIIVVVPTVTPSQFIAGLGIGSVAIGFAFKDVFENFLAGVIILGRDKMQIGDIIECEGVSGRIENIWIRETHVRRVDGELVIVPNAFLFQNPLRIQTDQKLKRQDMLVGVDYDTDLTTARDIMRAALESCSTPDASKGFEVKFVEFGASSLDFRLMWWTDSEPRSQRDSYDEVGFAVKAALDKAEITIPFPQSTLSLRPEAQPLRIASTQMAKAVND
jgi:small-conductance mechanosensitive channel